MVYKVRLYRIKSLSFEICGIHANNESEAATEAKKRIAYNGYWEDKRMTIEERMKKLTVESVTLDNR